MFLKLVLDSTNFHGIHAMLIRALAIFVDRSRSQSKPELTLESLLRPLDIIQTVHIEVPKSSVTFNRRSVNCIWS